MMSQFGEMQKSTAAYQQTMGPDTSMIVLDQQVGSGAHTHTHGSKKGSTSLEYDDTQLLKMVLLNGKAADKAKDHPKSGVQR